MIQVKFNDKAKQVLADTLDLSGSVVVTELPQVGEEHTIYELHTTTPSIISYWIYVNGEWVNIDENLEFETQDKTVSPTTESQNVTADSGYDGLGTVIVNAVTSAIDQNIIAENIKKDISILGVTGTYEGIEEIGKLNTITLPIESVTDGGVGVIPLSKIHFYLENKELDLVTIDSSDGDKERGYLVVPLLDTDDATYSLHIVFDNDVIFGGDSNLRNQPIFVIMEDTPHINIVSSSREYDLTIYVGTLRLFNGMLN